MQITDSAKGDLLKFARCRYDESESIYHLQYELKVIYHV